MALKHRTTKSQKYKRVLKEVTIRNGEEVTDDKWIGRFYHKGQVFWFRGFDTDREAAVAIDRFILEKKISPKKLQVLKPI